LFHLQVWHSVSQIDPLPPMSRPVPILRAALVVILLVLAIAGLRWAGRSPAENSPKAPPTAAAPDRAFRDWAAKFPTSAAATPPDEPLAQGIALAKARAPIMSKLMREDPARAIAEALSFDEWANLPVEVQTLVEKPFSVTADFDYYPVCGRPGSPLRTGAPAYLADLTMPSGEQLEAIVYGRREHLMSKRSLPVQGISLGGVAVIRDAALQKLPEPPSPKVRSLFPAGQSDLTRSFASGLPLGLQSVHAVSGGKLYAFADEAELADFNTRLDALDALPGPLAGSSVLTMAQPFAPADTGAFNWTAVERYAMEQASAWTETKKTLFLIRINFPDNVADPVTQSAALTEINGASSNLIRAMSYGKTWIEGAVSANLYTVAQNSTYYVNSGGSARNSELIRDARNKFRNTKSGGDSTINIGPVINSGNGDSGGLGDYDIVGVFFGQIGMPYAGLAGGSNLWVHDANYTSLYVHEWGHNYGLGHANFWQTSDGSVVGTGSSVEYGDDFDIMGGGPAPEGHFHPQGKAHLNWLTSTEWIDATANGSNTYRIYRIDSSATTGTPRGLRISKTVGPTADGYYWIGFRPAFTNLPNLERGAYLNWQFPGDHRSWLLDTTPNSGGGKDDGVILPGRTYADASSQVYITPLATGGSGAEQYLDVRVNVNRSPNAAPTASVISGPATVAARANAGFSVTGSDSNGDALAYYWDSGDGAIHDNANSLNINWTTGGSYTLNVTVSDMKGGTVTRSKTVTVTDPVDTWSQNSTGTTGDLQEAIWGKGRFVAADYWGTVYMSWDGTAWSNVGDLPSFEREPCLAFGNGMFVIGGRNDSGLAARNLLLRGWPHLDAGELSQRRAPGERHRLRERSVSGRGRRRDGVALH